MMWCVKSIMLGGVMCVRYEKKLCLFYSEVWCVRGWRWFRGGILFFIVVWVSGVFVLGWDGVSCGL